MTDREYNYWFNSIKGLGNYKKNRLLNIFGNPKEIFKAKKEDLIKIEGVGENTLASIFSSKSNLDFQKKFLSYEKQGIKEVTILDANYPKGIKALEDRPFMLYYLGQLPREEEIKVAIVGSRVVSEYGSFMAKKIASELASRGISVISGMATGIDSIAHKAALDAGGRSYAFLGSGVDVCYPSININIYNKMKEKGAIISEVEPSSKPIAGNFPRRNRLIAAICDLLIVVEARKKSGSLITADQALEQGKDIIVVPGRAYDPLSCGCNWLIKEGANIFTGIKDILDLPIIKSKLEKIGKSYNEEDKYRKIRLSDKEKKVANVVDSTPKSIEELMVITGINLEEISTILVDLELKKVVKEVLSGFFISF